jgi:hypothetical protein
MKRFVIILAALSALGLGSCTIKSYEIKSMEKATTISLKDFVNLELLVTDNSGASVFDSVYVDRNADVLYLKQGYGFSPIMKADGTCLTLTEWKESRRND